MNLANFGPLDEAGDVYGACRPGHLGGDLAAWTDILAEEGVTDVVCLLGETEAKRWGLPDAYADAFETAHVPIRDRHLPEPDNLRRAVHILETATSERGRAAVHCNAGLGRTGIVASAWLVHAGGFEPAAAVETVETGPMRRSPREAIRDGNATESELYSLLESV